MHINTHIRIQTFLVGLFINDKEGPRTKNGFFLTWPLSCGAVCTSMQEIPTLREHIRSQNESGTIQQN